MGDASLIALLMTLIWPQQATHLASELLDTEILSRIPNATGLSSSLPSVQEDLQIPR